MKRTWPHLLGLSLGLLVLVAAVALPLAVRAQDNGPNDNDVNRVAKQLYCPVCENVPLDVCPTQACAQWRALIREKLAAGWSDQQIKDYFVDQYGDRVLSTPPARGLNWLVYVLPPLALLGGAALLVSVVRAWSSAAETPDEPRTTVEDDPYVAELEAELRAREAGGANHDEVER
ncbi:MAG: cytochrome c-type biogenesis protein CcmH [Anaerolineales bacterium]